MAKSRLDQIIDLVRECGQLVKDELFHNYFFTFLLFYFFTSPVYHPVF